MKCIGKETNGFFKKKQYEKSLDLCSYPHVFVESNCAKKSRPLVRFFCSEHPLYLGLQATLFSNQALKLPANLPTFKYPFKSYILNILIIHFFKHRPLFLFPYYVLGFYSFSKLCFKILFFLLLFLLLLILLIIGQVLLSQVIMLLYFPKIQ